MPGDRGNAQGRGSAQGRSGGEPGLVGGPGLADGVELLADADRPGSWVLLADGVLQSHVDLDDPQHLELEYVRRIGHLIDAAAPPGLPLRALHLGGGGLTLARYVSETRPGSAQLAVESDPRVVGLVRSRLPVDGPGEGADYPDRSRTQPGRPGAGRPGAGRPGAGRPGAGRPGAEESWGDEPGAEPRWIGAGIRVRVGDARAVLEQVPAGSFDVLVADVFVGGSTPAHVTSVEFTAVAARALAPSGIYIANIGDGPVHDDPVRASPVSDGSRGDGLTCDGPVSLGSAGDGPVSRSAALAHTRGRVAAARSVFACVYLIAEPAVLRGRRFGNLVLAAADHELAVERLTRRFAADPFPARLLEGAELDRFVAGSLPITDVGAKPSPTPPADAFI